MNNARRQRVPTAAIPKRFLSVKETASSLCLSVGTIYKLVNTGQLAAVKVGDRTLIPASGIDDFEQKLLAEAPYPGMAS